MKKRIRYTINIIPGFIVDSNSCRQVDTSGEINLQVFKSKGHPIICVSDNGPGIPVEYHQRVLERFQRLDSARSSSGSGLGLSLVNAVANLHHATLSLKNNHPGLRVELKFQRLLSADDA